MWIKNTTGLFGVLISFIVLYVGYIGALTDTGIIDKHKYHTLADNTRTRKDYECILF